MSLASSRRSLHGIRLGSRLEVPSPPGDASTHGPESGPGADLLRVEARTEPDGGTAALFLPTGRSEVPSWLVRSQLERLPPQITVARTAVLTEPDAGPFLEAGFAIAVTLEVLTHDLRGLPGRRSVPVPPGVVIRTMRRGELDAALHVDQLAFAAIDGIPDTAVARGWSAPESLDDAMRATPVSRARVAMRGTEVLGFAVCGRARRAGYLQRLAVHPAAQGSGIGSALIVDALRWCRRHRVRRVAVNTHVGNAPALRRYQRLGFEICRPRLVICELVAGMPTGAP